VPARGRPGARARQGEGKVYKAGRLWSIRWTENAERRYSGGYLSEDNARKVLAVVGLNIQAGRPGLEQIRLAKAPDSQPSGPCRLADRRAKGRRSVDDDRPRWNRHLAPLIRDLLKAT
jgi:hypothetical protein